MDYEKLFDPTKANPAVYLRDLVSTRVAQGLTEAELRAIQQMPLSTELQEKLVTHGTWDHPEVAALLQQQHEAEREADIRVKEGIKQLLEESLEEIKRLWLQVSAGAESFPSDIALRLSVKFAMHIAMWKKWAEYDELAHRIKDEHSMAEAGYILQLVGTLGGSIDMVYSMAREWIIDKAREYGIDPQNPPPDWGVRYIVGKIRDVDASIEGLRKQQYGSGQERARQLAIAIGYHCNPDFPPVRVGERARLQLALIDMSTQQVLELAVELGFDVNEFLLESEPVKEPEMPAPVEALMEFIGPWNLDRWLEEIGAGARAQSAPATYFRQDEGFSDWDLDEIYAHASTAPIDILTGRAKPGVRYPEWKRRPEPEQDDKEQKDDREDDPLAELLKLAQLLNGAKSDQELAGKILSYLSQFLPLGLPGAFLAALEAGLEFATAFSILLGALFGQTVASIAADPGLPMVAGTAVASMWSKATSNKWVEGISSIMSAVTTPGAFLGDSFPVGIGQRTDDLLPRYSDLVERAIHHDI